MQYMQESVNSKKLEVLILERLSHDSKKASNFIEFLPDFLCNNPRLRYI